MYLNAMYCKIKRSMNLGYVCYLEIKTLEYRGWSGIQRVIWDTKICVQERKWSVSRFIREILG